MSDYTPFGPGSTYGAQVAAQNGHNQAFIVRAALEFKGRGFAPIPVPHGTKKVTRKGWPDEKYAAEEIPQAFPDTVNIGILLGKPSGDLIDVDLDCQEAWEAAPYFLPETDLIHGRRSKPRSHWEYIVRGSTLRRNTWRDPLDDDDETNMLLELRGNKHQTIFPPSQHPSGEWYCFYSDGEPAAVEETDLVASANKLAACALLARRWKHLKGSRDETAMALCGALVRAGWTPEETDDFVRTVARIGADEEWGQRGKAEQTSEKLLSNEAVTGWTRLAELIDEKTVEKVRRWLGIRRNITPSAALVQGTALRAAVPESGGNYNLTDMGNAERMICLHGADIRYIPPMKKWFLWDGVRWQPDDREEVSHLAHLTVKSIHVEAAAAGDKTTTEALARHALWSENGARVREMVQLAKGIGGVRALPTDLDTECFSLVCQNGTLDLRSGEFRESRREDLNTKLAPVTYDPDAACPTWTTFLERIMDGNQDLIDFLQQAVGLCLSGDISEQVMFILYGTGANGKSTFLEVVHELLGDYAAKLRAESLMLKKGEPIREDIASLRGTRFAYTVETSDGRRLDEAMIKEIVGDEFITARFLHQNSFTYRRQFKTWMATNHKPEIRGTDHGIWRRIRLVPFTVKIPDDQQDHGLKRKLLAELPGILNWAVEGFRRWSQEGLGQPKAIVEATAAYREEMDLLGDFIESWCETGPGKRSTVAEVYQEFVSWCVSNGEKFPPTQRRFGTSLAERGFERKRGTGNVWMWEGICLRPAEQRVIPRSEEGFA